MSSWGHFVDPMEGEKVKADDEAGGSKTDDGKVDESEVDDTFSLGFMVALAILFILLPALGKQLYYVAEGVRGIITGSVAVATKTSAISGAVGVKAGLALAGIFSPVGIFVFTVVAAGLITFLGYKAYGYLFNKNNDKALSKNDTVLLSEAFPKAKKKESLFNCWYCLGNSNTRSSLVENNSGEGLNNTKFTPN